MKALVFGLMISSTCLAQTFQCNILNYHQFPGATGNIAKNGAVGKCVWYVENSILGPSRIYVEYTPNSASSKSFIDQCILDNKQIIKFDYTSPLKPKCQVIDPKN